MSEAKGMDIYMKKLMLTDFNSLSLNFTELGVATCYSIDGGSGSGPYNPMGNSLYDWLRWFR